MRHSRNLLNILRLFTVLISFQLLAACETLEPLRQDPSDKPVAETESPSASPTTEPTFEEKLATEKLLENRMLNPDNLQPGLIQPSLNLTRPQLAEDEKAIRIAILLPLSGQHGKVGNDLLNAANMALFDHNNSQLKLQSYDTKGTEDGARKAAMAAAREGAEIILGPLFSASVKAIQPIAQQHNINILAFSTDVTVASEGVYLMGLTAQQQLDRILEFSYRQGLVNFAVLAPQTPYGDTAVSSIQESIRHFGLNLTQVQRYPADLLPGSTELQDIARRAAHYDARRARLQQEIRKVKNKDDSQSRALLQKLSKLDTFGDVAFEALIIPEGGQRLRELAPLLSYYDIDPKKVQFIGTGLWADVSLTTEPSLVGGWFAAPAPEATNSFLSRFNSIYGYTPPRIASLAYDALALSGLLALDDGPQRFSNEKLQNNDGFSGYNGIFRFKASGLAERGLAIIQLGQENLELLEAAPSTFTPVLN